jgi:hypothetical protein
MSDHKETIRVKINKKEIVEHGNRKNQRGYVAREFD